MSANSIGRFSWVATALWLLHGAVLLVAARTTIYGADTSVVDGVAKAADLARDKDIVWLSLVTAIAAIVFSAWLVRQLTIQQAKVLEALIELKQGRSAPNQK